MTGTGIELIAQERQRQIDSEGYTPENDDTHDLGQMASAAAAYALYRASYPGIDEEDIEDNIWPWEIESFKPRDAISNLVRAGALIAAEIDRLQRAAS